MKHILTTIVIAIVVSLITAWAMAPHVTQSGTEVKTKGETADDLLLRTNTIRCGYVVYAPYIMKDPNTNVLSGMFYDLTNKIGELGHVKIEWTQETNYATMVEDLESHRYDAFCGGLWPMVDQAKLVDYSIAVNFSGLGVYVRTDDHRFDQNVMMLNDPAYKLATIDGDSSEILHNSDFPKAGILTLPNSADISLLAETVATGKADATIIGEIVATKYMEIHPGTLRRVDGNHPLRVYENLWAFPFGSPRLVSMFNTAIKEMLYDGTVDRIMSGYGRDAVDFYPLATPYKAPNN